MQYPTEAEGLREADTLDSESGFTVEEFEGQIRNGSVP
jgi:hypothetical protein